MRNLQNTRLLRAGVVLIALSLSLGMLPTARAASAVLSIKIDTVTIFPNGCAPGRTVFQLSVTVSGVPDGGTFAITSHFGGVGGWRAYSFPYGDTRLERSITPATFINGTGWTAPNDFPQVYYEASANGTTVRTPTITIDCAAGTYSGLSMDDDSSTSGINWIADGRINAYEIAAPVAVYPVQYAEGTGLHFYAIDSTGEGELALEVTPAMIAAVPEMPAENTLIASTPDGSIAFYRLTTGEYQMNAGSYVIAFSELYTSAAYYMP